MREAAMHWISQLIDLILERPPNYARHGELVKLIVTAIAPRVSFSCRPAWPGPSRNNLSFESRFCGIEEAGFRAPFRVLWTGNSRALRKTADLRFDCLPPTLWV
jgi:hypothetical protein